MSKSNLRIIFMGTPDFAVPSLKILLEHKYNIVAVVTAPDNPSGRGQKVSESAVKQFAKEKGLRILQPSKLSDPEFISELSNLKPDLQVVVAFRMLPEIVWNMPVKGTINLHASLLPQYRGAAPINRAIINGEMVTGVTTFFIRQEIDTGDIIFQKKVKIGEKETAGELHDRLMVIGAGLLLKTVEGIENDSFQRIKQSIALEKIRNLKTAPKIFKEECRINWEQNISYIYDFIRGLSPYPAAWTELVKPDGKILSLKIFTVEKDIQTHNFQIGILLSDNKNYIKVTVNEGFINIKELQLAGKKRLSVKEFLRGANDIGNYKIV